MPSNARKNRLSATLAAAAVAALLAAPFAAAAQDGVPEPDSAGSENAMVRSARDLLRRGFDFMENQRGVQQNQNSGNGSGDNTSEHGSDRLGGGRSGSGENQDIIKVNTNNNTPDTNPCLLLNDGTVSSATFSLNSKIERMKQRQNVAVKKLKISRNSVDTQLAQFAKQWSKQRRAEFVKLQAEAKTAEQQKAVQDFVASINSAEQQRDAAVAQALSSYRAGIDRAIAEHQQQMQTAADNFKTAVASAVQNFNEDCANRADSSQARSSFRERLQQAQQDLSDDRQHASGVSSEIQSLIQARNGQVSSILQQFKNEIKQASDALNATLK